MTLPGYPVDDGFRWRPAGEVTLSPEARKRVRDKVDAVARARWRALASMSQAVIGGHTS